jgi:hypothetical protein
MGKAMPLVLSVAIPNKIAPVAAPRKASVQVYPPATCSSAKMTTIITCPFQAPKGKARLRNGNPLNESSSLVARIR